MNDRRHDVNTGTKGGIIMTITGFGNTLSWKAHPVIGVEQINPTPLLYTLGKREIGHLSGSFLSKYSWFPLPKSTENGDQLSKLHYGDQLSISRLTRC
ncbi:hypothetical protein AVEN_6724-1 [Araneus ventricosus]|uniref:Uncharacterized protein n=1 Tax=Araneus ventricosus TaxID=182803 RepID=A0A4Y2T6A6_ARAVE|nr:hypothetical protein AVEN_69730-1 [Araneus ventricosus]GBN94934.1 hypothetical protein AVEN_6724-1 [Araneus ventricosus]